MYRNITVSTDLRMCI